MFMRSIHRFLFLLCFLAVVFLASLPGYAEENLSYVEQETQLPATMLTGEHYLVSVTMMNAGTMDWSAEEGYKLVATTGSFFPRELYFEPYEVIGSGKSKTFYFQVRAPYYPGTYTVSWQM